MATDKTLSEQTHECEIYNFDGSEFVECPHKLWIEILATLTTAEQFHPNLVGAELFHISVAAEQVRASNSTALEEAAKALHKYHAVKYMGQARAMARDCLAVAEQVRASETDEVMVWKNGQRLPGTVAEFTQSLRLHAGWADKEFLVRSDPASQLGGLLSDAADLIDHQVQL